MRSSPSRVKVKQHQFNQSNTNENASISLCNHNSKEALITKGKMLVKQYAIFISGAKFNSVFPIFKFHI